MGTSNTEMVKKAISQIEKCNFACEPDVKAGLEEIQSQHKNGFYLLIREVITLETVLVMTAIKPSQKTHLIACKRYRKC